MSSAVEGVQEENASDLTPNKRKRVECQGILEGITKTETDSLLFNNKLETSNDRSSIGSNEAYDAVKEFEHTKANLITKEPDFIELLKPELENFNLFFMEKEEEYIIPQKELHERIQIVKNISGPNGIFPSSTKYDSEMIEVRKDIVNFHGEMVLLENNNALNDTGLVKILKKYDKIIGGLLCIPFIERVLQQPFFTTELLLKLMKECKTTLQYLFPIDEELPVEETAKMDVNEALPFNSNGEDVESTLYRSTIVAVCIMKEMHKGSYTYSIFSLPPLYDVESTEIIQKKSPVLLCSATPICPPNCAVTSILSTIKFCIHALCTK
eukprot:Gb_10743 [translate_table: standard]